MSLTEKGGSLLDSKVIFLTRRGALRSSEGQILSTFDVFLISTYWLENVSLFNTLNLNY